MAAHFIVEVYVRQPPPPNPCFGTGTEPTAVVEYDDTDTRRRVCGGFPSLASPHPPVASR